MPNDTNFFVKESAFEAALVDHLRQYGWGESEVIMNPTEDDLVRNWASIIFDMNRGINQLDRYPLTDGEMQQILAQVDACPMPFDRNKWINGGEICIKRDNQADHNNYGKNVYLKIFDAQKICSGESRYQIVRQPRFRTADDRPADRRGDVMLLINGMPVVHIELKRSKVDVSQAIFQIKRYTHEGIFSRGIFSLVQIFVAMTPEQTRYFANPGKEELFMDEFQFHWADFNNNETKDWRKVATDLLSIPMAHEMVGMYTIADEKDKVLKVLRSYQYYAVNKLRDRTHQVNWDTHRHLGGYIWHTTGSGKTMTSFKAAQLIANSGDADKVVFLMDRIELSTQSLEEYRGFAGDNDEVQDTEDTSILMSKLESTDNDDRLIVTSIQKMALIRPDRGVAPEWIKRIGQKRLVFIVDECHRSVFGEKLLPSIKNTFPRALLFGFTGTPVFEENAHGEITTETLFGDMLHKYTIANAIPDGNVLGFDVYKVETYSENELREKAAFSQLDVHNIEEVEDDEAKMAVYNRFIDELQMQDTYTENGQTRHGIEHYLPKNIYQQDVHHEAVARDIMKEFPRLSDNGKFHAMLATQNIPEAIAYYHLFKEQYPSLKVVTVFDNNIDNSDEGIAREDAIREMLDDYNQRYGTTFQPANYAKYKKDVAKRLAHKKPYVGIENDHAQQIDLLIVVTQMLTGYDSKWVNTLYVDKVMKYVDIIQAFSRTNRLFGPDKPFGTIRYYSFPFTMEQHINDALEVYVDRPLGVWVDKLERNLTTINELYLHIRDIFFSHELFNFERLPDTREDRNMFAQDFVELTRKIKAAKLQGFVWDKREYEFPHGNSYTTVTMEIDEATYETLLQRYRELFTGGGGGSEGHDFDYPINTYIAETGTGTIDAEFINARFTRYVKNLYTEGPQSELTKKAQRELHKTFATLLQKDQRTAAVILHDIQSGDLRLEIGKTIQDYIAEYQLKELYKQIQTLSEATGVNQSQLRHIMESGPTETTINEGNRFDSLKNTLNLTKTKEFEERVYGSTIAPRLVSVRADRLLRDFILDSEQRARILKAYLNDDLTLETATSDADETATEVPETTEITAFNIAKAKAGVRSVLENTLQGLVGQMRPLDEVVGSVFYVMQKQSTEALDGVDLHLEEAFYKLYCKESIFRERFNAFNILVTKFEAYLKKLYYLMKGEEVQPRNPGERVSLSNVLYAHRNLWNLKYSTDPAKQQLYQYLNLVKAWRNDESHISPTSTDQELNAALSVIITMYFYATGSSITDLEMNGYDMILTEEDEPHILGYAPVEEPEYSMAAEDIEIYGNHVEVILKGTSRQQLMTESLDLVLMYAIGPAARTNTQNAGKLALGLKDENLTEEAIRAYTGAKTIMFHYWKNSEATPFTVTAPIRLVSSEEVPEGYLRRLDPNHDAKHFLLVDYDPSTPADLGNIDILNVQRKGRSRYIPFVTKLDSLK